MTAGSLTLAGLLAEVETTRVVPDVRLADVVVREVRDDSRRVEAGDLFVAVPGTAADGGTFVSEAFARGAQAVVAQRDAGAFVAPPGRTLVLVPNVRRALGVIAANRHGAARSLQLMAVTGTNGKTTTTYLVEAMLAAAGRVAGVIGTVSYRSAAWTGGHRAAPLTTPGALMLHGLFAEMHEAGTTDVVLEASSHALDQGRLDGCRFRVAAMTNLTQDHLDYHVTMDRYFDAKAILFERLMDPARGVAVLMLDDEGGRRMRGRAAGKTLGVTLRPEENPGADITVGKRSMSADGMRAVLETPVGRIPIESPMVGEFNLSNLALAVGIGVARGLTVDAIASGLAGLSGVPGRLERVANARGVLCVVDYSHTPDALERAIAALRPLTTGRLVVVFGCGGDRDRGKRPLMGQVAARDADLVIVTSDNPRSESPDKIVDMILEGVNGVGVPALEASALRTAARGFHREVDRRRAIGVAAAAVGSGDVLLIAGKGHEDYQIIGTTKLHFDDRLEAAAALAAGSPPQGGRA